MHNFRTKYGVKVVFLALILGFMAVPVSAQAVQAPAKLQAALILKLLAFYTNLGDKPFTIHVIGASDVAAELKSLVGKTAGKATLNAVTESDGVPGDKPEVVYVGKDVASSIAFTQGNKVLSVTGLPNFVTDGVTLGIGIEDKKPKILLNLSSSKAEDINWNPAILKVAATIN
jgi:hypothetical protein